MEGPNSSTIFLIESEDFELGHLNITQVGTWETGACSGYPEKSFFQESVKLYFHGAVRGWVHNNFISWTCGGFQDLDVSDRIIYEDNIVHNTERSGVVIHGNA